MSTVIAKNIQIGTSGTPAQNFTWYQPAAPDGTIRLGVGNSGVTTGDVITATSAGVTVSGSVTGGAGSFTTLAASSTVSGTGFSNYLASPPAIGGTTPAAVSSTNLSYTGTFTGGTGIVNLGSGQFYKDASGNVGIGTANPSSLQSGTFGQTIAGSFPGLTLSGTEASGRTYTIYESAGLLKVYDRNAAVDRLAIDSGGNFQFNSGYGSVAIAYGCRAWVNFNGTTSPGTIRASGNVSSVTRNAAGDYTVNFTTALSDANYAMTGTCVASASAGYGASRVSLADTTAQTASACRVFTGYQNSSAFQVSADNPYVELAFFR